MRTSVIGTFNNLHPYVDKGLGAADLYLIYDRLMTESQDELYSVYGNLAESAEVADDYSWVAFTIRDNAYWHDGEPITVEDVIWTFNTIKTKGSVGWKTAYKDVLNAEKIGPRTLRFNFTDTAVKTPQLAMQMSSFMTLPKHYWKDRTFNATTLDPPLGSGPYRIRSVDVGHKIVYERVVDYWGRDLNVNVGTYNFDTLEYIYFMDKNLVIQAMKAGVFDYKREFNTEDYATAYDFWGLREGVFKKVRHKLGLTYGMDWSILFNTRIEKLKDIRVREALTLAYNFDWSDRVLWHGFQKRNISFFILTGLATRGMPSKMELELLEPFRGRIPDRVFTDPFDLPQNGAYGRNRDTLLQADELLAEAGWVVKGFQRINKDTGEPFTLEFITSSVARQRLLVPYVETLQRLGIAARIRRIDSNLLVNRLRNYDFESFVEQIWLNNIPVPAWIRSRFLSINVNRPYMGNLAGIDSPAVDFLVEKIIFAKSEEEMNAAGRALDRILLWSFYVIPGGYPKGRKFVYWDRFGFPPPESMKWNGWHALWWLDEAKNARVDAAIDRFKRN